MGGRICSAFQLVLACVLVGVCCTAQSDDTSEGTVEIAYQDNLRVRIFHDGGWGTVCSEGITPDDAMVICRTLYGPEAIGMPQPAGPLLELPEDTKIWLLTPGCTGSEQSLNSCPGGDLANLVAATGGACANHSNDVMVNCAMPETIGNGDGPGTNGSTTTSSLVQVELMDEGGLQPIGQRLELLADGTWGTVCFSGFSLNDAKVACVMKYGAGGQATVTGFAVPAVPPATPLTNIPVWVLAGLQCTGDEQSLDECPGAGSWTLASAEEHADCLDHANDVSVDCAISDPFSPPVGADESTPPPPPEGPPAGTLRLLDDDPQPMGRRMEVYVNGAWGSVCFDTFSSEDAQVACANMFGAGGQVFTMGHPWAATAPDPPMSDVPVWALNLQCTGTEKSFDECPGGSWSDVKEASDASCLDHAYDVSLDCLMESVTTPPPPKPNKCTASSGCKAGYTGKAANPCDPSARTFVKCKDGAFVQKQTCWKKQVFNKFLAKCVQPCDSAAACPTGYTGKAANTCDPSNRTFLVCKDGALEKQQTCWKKQVFSKSLAKCAPPCNATTGCSTQACEPGSACTSKPTGKAANPCDPTRRTFVVCARGAFVEQQTCWKQEFFNATISKCTP